MTDAQPPWGDSTSRLPSAQPQPAASDTSEELLEEPSAAQTLRNDTTSYGMTTVQERRELMRVGRITGFLEKPKLYSGEGPERFAEWTTWSRKMRNHLGSFNFHYEKLIELAEQATEPITELKTTPTFPTLTVEDLQNLSVDLRQVLTSFMTSNAAVLLESFMERTSNGFELWRLMNQEYRLRTTDTSRKLLREIINYAFNQDDFVSSLATWEGMIAKYERTSTKKIDPEVLMSTLMNAARGPLRDHLILHVDDIADYQALRGKVLSWHKTHTSIESGNDTYAGVNAVDATYIAYLKGKAKGKGMWRNRYLQRGKGNYDNYKYSNYYNYRTGKGKGNNYKGNNYNNNWNNFNAQKGKRDTSRKGKGKKGTYRKGQGKKGNFRGKGKGKNNFGNNNNNNFRRNPHSTSSPAHASHTSPTPMEIGAVELQQYWEDEDWWNFPDYEEGDYWDEHEEHLVAGVTNDEGDWYFDEEYYDDQDYYESYDGWQDFESHYGSEPWPENLAENTGGAPTASATSAPGTSSSSRGIQALSTSTPAPAGASTSSGRPQTSATPQTSPTPQAGTSSTSQQRYVTTVRTSPTRPTLAWGCGVTLNLDTAPVAKNSKLAENLVGTVNNITTVPTTGEYLLDDSGAAMNTCPLGYANVFPLRDDEQTRKELEQVTLRTADGSPLKTFGKRLVHYCGKYLGREYHFSVDYVVTNTALPIISEQLLLQDNNLELHGNGLERHVRCSDFELPLVKNGDLWWFIPEYFDVSGLDNFECAMNPLNKSKEAVTDFWELEFDFLVRKHLQWRKYLFNPATTADLPEGVHLGLLTPTRTTLVNYETGDSETLEDTWEVNDKRRKLQTWWSGETRFKLQFPSAELAPESSTSQQESSAPAALPAPPGLEQRVLYETSDETPGDFWIIHEEDLLRVHTRLRQKYFVPSGIGGLMPIPKSWLLAQRTTKGNFEDGQVLHDVDEWTKDVHLKNEEIKTTVKKWTGFTSFLIDSAKRLECTDLQEHICNCDFWERIGTTWKRHHCVARTRLYVPQNLPQGPTVELLRCSRRTYINYEDGEKDELLDDYLKVGTKALDRPWKGLTVFQEDFEAVPEGTSGSALPAKELRRPQQPTADERRLHELTHLPFRSWCRFCVLGKGRANQSRRGNRHLPVVQVDYAFAPIDGGNTPLTLLTAVDVQTFMSIALVVPKKGVCVTATRALENFLLETGRTNAVLQSDSENPIQSLLAELCKMTPGLSRRHAPAYTSRAMGSIGNLQTQLYGQIRTLRAFLEEMSGITLRLSHVVVTWLVLYCSFLLTRYLVHEDGHTSYFRRWGRNYQGALCSFGEVLQYLLPRKPRDKLAPKFQKGIYLGKCSETNESFVGTLDGQVIRARTLRRLSGDETWQNKDFLAKLKQKPFDVGTGHRSVKTSREQKDTSDQRPPQAPLPPGARLPDEAPEQLAARQELAADDLEEVNMDDDDLDLDDDGDVDMDGTSTSGTGASSSSSGTLPSASQRRSLDDADTALPNARRQRVASLWICQDNYVCNLHLPGKITSEKQFAECHLPIVVNEVLETVAYDTFEQEEMADLEENITRAQADAADLEELESIRNFGVYEEVDDLGQPHELTRFVRKRKSTCKVKSRLVVKQLKVKTKHAYDLDDLYASTPSFATLKILLTIGLAMGWSMFTCDVSTAFLHAPLPEELQVLVKPPDPHYVGKLWLLRKALYGLRSAPAAWQKHFARVVCEELHFSRSKYDANVYFNIETKTWVLVHVDDLFITGELHGCRTCIRRLGEFLLLKETGDLNSECSQVTFLGRTLKRVGDGIHFIIEKQYFEKMFEEADVNTSRSVNLPGVKSRDVSELARPLDAAEHALYRRLVGKLQWICPLRPDITFATKECARRLCNPTLEDWTSVTQILRYLVGTTHYVSVLEPAYRLAEMPKTLDIVTFADSDWAGCKLTRKSTSGIVVQLLGTTILFASRTQETVALSSGEAELYAVGSTVSEGLFVANFLREVGLCSKTTLTTFTDSTAGKSLASRFGTSRRTRHVDARLLFMQELVERGLLRLKKIAGPENVADLGTKHVTLEVLHKFLERVGLFECALEQRQ